MFNSLLFLSLFIFLFAEIEGTRNVTRYNDFNRVKKRHESKGHHDEHVRNSGRRLIGGMKAEDGQFPFMAYLKYDDTPKCSATIIHKRWILTAAHCLNEYRINSATITVGSNTLHGKNAGSKTYEPELFIIHKGYDLIPEDQNGGLEYVVNDIGLIRLKEDLQFNRKIKPIKLPSTDENNHENEWVTFSGWGSFNHSYQMSNRLLFGYFKVLPQADCRAVWTYVKDDHICTEINPTLGACYGDSGGPLITDKRVQIGIASTADTYCEQLKPDLYTRVSSFVPWIRNQLAQYHDNLFIDNFYW